MPAPFAYVLLYVTLYGAFGVASPYWPKLFESKGLTPQQIGLILAAALLMRLAAGPWSDGSPTCWARCVLSSQAASSRQRQRRPHTRGPIAFWLVLLIALVQAAALAPTTSLADALTVNAARPRKAGKPFEYGRIRGAASLAFLVGTLVIGQLIVPADLSPIIWMNAALLIVAAAATALLPGGAPEPDPRADMALAAAKVRGLLELSPFRVVIVVSALVYGSHALYDAFAVIRWSAAGLPAPVISVLWAEAVAAEVIVFLLDRTVAA